MVEALRHRGPDGEARPPPRAATLVHTRLAIIDVAGGDQPLDSEDGAVTAVVNGEIYNHRELRARARARRATASPPAPTARWSCTATRSTGRTSCASSTASSPSRSGTPASAGSWPPATSSASSRSTGGPTAAASRSPPRSARCSPPAWWSPEVDRGGARPLPRLPLRARAADAVRGRQQAARRVAAGRAEERGRRASTSFREAPGEPLAGASEDELADELAERFTDAVERQMMSDVPYGAFLSGGVDSAAVVAAMARRAGSRPPPSRSASPATATAGRARVRRRERPPDRHRPPRHRDGAGRLPGGARALRAAARGAVRNPLGAGAAAALPLRRRAT